MFDSRTLIADFGKLRIIIFLKMLFSWATTEHNNFPIIQKNNYIKYDLVALAGFGHWSGHAMMVAVNAEVTAAGPIEACLKAGYHVVLFETGWTPL